MRNGNIENIALLEQVNNSEIWKAPASQRTLCIPLGSSTLGGKQNHFIEMEMNSYLELVSKAHYACLAGRNEIKFVRNSPRTRLSFDHP